MRSLANMNVNMFHAVLSPKVTERACVLWKKVEDVQCADAERERLMRREQAAMEIHELDSLLASLALPCGAEKDCRALMRVSPWFFSSSDKLKVIMDAASGHEAIGVRERLHL